MEFVAREVERFRSSSAAADYIDSLMAHLRSLLEAVGRLWTAMHMRRQECWFAAFIPRFAKAYPRPESASRRSPYWRRVVPATAQYRFRRYSRSIPAQGKLPIAPAPRTERSAGTVAYPPFQVPLWRSETCAPSPVPILLIFLALNPIIRRDNGPWPIALAQDTLPAGPILGTSTITTNVMRAAR